MPEFAALLARRRGRDGRAGPRADRLRPAGPLRGHARRSEFTARVREFMARRRAPDPAAGRCAPRLPADAGAGRRAATPRLHGRDRHRRRAPSSSVPSAHDLYGVPPEAVVGTLIAYDYDRAARTGPPCRRTTGCSAARPTRVPPRCPTSRRQLGRRPVLAAGNSGGDREMLEWAAAGERTRRWPSSSTTTTPSGSSPTRAPAETVAEPEPITDVGAPAGLDGGQHGPGLGDGLRPRPDLGRAGSVATARRRAGSGRPRRPAGRPERPARWSTRAAPGRACDHTSGVAARVPSPGGQHGSPVGGRPSQTCSEIMSLGAGGGSHRGEVRRAVLAGGDGVLAPLAGEQSASRGRGSRRCPGSVISHCPPSRVSP